MLRSPTRSARRHAATLRLSDRTVRRILHQDLHFHPYKMVVAQELSERDWNNRVAACENMVENLPREATFLVMRHIFTCLAPSTSKTSGTGVPITRGRYTKSLCIVRKSQFGAPCQK